MYYDLVRTGVTRRSHARLVYNSILQDLLSLFLISAEPVVVITGSRYDRVMQILLSLLHGDVGSVFISESLRACVCYNRDMHVLLSLQQGHVGHIVVGQSLYTGNRLYLLQSSSR